jgi:hypothetical protein
VDQGTAAVLGAAISGAVALGGLLVGSWLATRRQRGEYRGERLARFMASAESYVMAVGQVARAESDQKANLESQLVWKYMDSVIAALAEIRLHDAEHVVDAAEDLDAALGDLIGEAREQQFSRDDWRSARDPIIKSQMAQMRQLARAANE